MTSSPRNINPAFAARRLPEGLGEIFTRAGLRDLIEFLAQAK